MRFTDYIRKILIAQSTQEVSIGVRHPMSNYKQSDKNLEIPLRNYGTEKSEETSSRGKTPMVTQKMVRI